MLSHEGSTYDIEGKDNSGNTVIFQRRQAVVVFNGNVVEKQIKGVVASYLRYDVRGNVIGIYNDEAMTTPIVTYGYDESGNRISMTNANGSTYYVYDAMGNSIAIYTGTAGTTFSQVSVYGSERLGIFTVSGGGYAYEMGDNVGSVKVVINRNRTSTGTLDVMQYNDYYPFGSIARQGGNGYRFEYQGAYAEKDLATGFNNFDLRLYDSKIGRWLSVDPEGQFWSPYNGMGNNPVISSDPTGGESYWHWDKQTGALVADKGDNAYSLSGYINVDITVAQNILSNRSNWNDGKLSAVGSLNVSYADGLYLNNNIPEVRAQWEFDHSSADLQHGVETMMPMLNASKYSLIGVSYLIQPGMVAENLLANGASRASRVLANSSLGLARARALGLAVEKAVGVGTKLRIPSITGSAKYRIPDKLTETTLEEVKNVGHLSMTKQLTDFYLYAQQKGLQMVIHVRWSTTFSAPLQKLIDNGSIVKEFIKF
nr:putative toxin [Mucilaginibacter sp. JRF]